MARKVTVCLSVFMLLLIGAFSLDRQLSQEFHNHSVVGGNGMVQIQQFEDGTGLETIKQEIFAPREYVRIISSERK